VHLAVVLAQHIDGKAHMGHIHRTQVLTRCRQGLSLRPARTGQKFALRVSHGQVGDVLRLQPAVQHIAQTGVVTRSQWQRHRRFVGQLDRRHPSLGLAQQVRIDQAQAVANQHHHHHPFDQQAGDKQAKAQSMHKPGPLHRPCLIMSTVSAT